MPFSHRHAHPQRDLSDTIGEIMEGLELVKRAPQNGQGGGGQMPTAIDKPTNTKGIATDIVKATGNPEPDTSDDMPDMTTTQPLSAPTSSSDKSSSDEEGGLGAGATAGIVFGVLGGVLIIAAIIYFAFASRRKNKSAGDGEEKFVPVSGPPPPLPMKDIGKSPRLSLRPVTQFFPNLNSKPSKPEAPYGAAAVNAWRSQGPAPFERPDTSQSSHPANPFGSQAERAPSPVTESHSMRNIPPTPDRNMKPLPSGGRQTSMHADAQRNMDFTLPSQRPPSPAGTEFSMTSIAPEGGPAPQTSGGAAIAAAGGPKNTSVHRVQLDFKPSLSDEMELNAGELVRLLHEYDDGWALCIRLDRTRQGVVPRTCLSTRPVKPRPPQGGGPRGPPVNPQRPESPAGRPRTATGPGPASPGSFRSQSPMGRPMSPGGRSQSPGPRNQQQSGRPRAPSKSHGPSPMNPAARPAAPSPGPFPGMAM